MQRPTEFAQCFIDRMADRMYTDDELMRRDQEEAGVPLLPRPNAATAWIHHAFPADARATLVLHS